MNRKPMTPSAPGTTASTTEDESDIQEQIRRRAYELYEERGGADRRELDDWLQAEAEVTLSMTRAVAA